MYEYRKASGKMHVLPPKLWTQFRNLFEFDYHLPGLGTSYHPGEIAQFGSNWFKDFLESEPGAKMANRLLQVSLPLIPLASDGYYELSLMAEVVTLQSLKCPGGRSIWYLRPEFLCIREVQPPETKLEPKAT
jgi:hypothetical protein